MKKIAGTCSRCGGAVIQDDKILQCSRCGVVKREKLPVINMNEDVIEQLLTEG